MSSNHRPHLERAARLGRMAAWFALAVVATGIAATPPLGAQRRPQRPPRLVRNAILIAFRDKVPAAERIGLLRRLGLRPDPRVRSRYFVRVAIPPAVAARFGGREGVLAALRRDPAVRVAEVEPVARLAARFPNDPLYPHQYALDNRGQNGGNRDADIDAPEAWRITTGSDAVVVAVIDTGIDLEHPDLAPNLLRRNDGSVVGYDFANDDPVPQDDHGHGTHVAGIIGARGNNALGIAGVCHQVRLMPVKVFTAAGEASLGDIIQGIDFARENGARVLNNSWSLFGTSQLLLEAILRAEAAGVLVVAAAGNDPINGDEFPGSPARYAEMTENVISVAATDERDRLADFSTWGPESVLIAAPGVEILSTWPGEQYQRLTGTSMAAPLVSGVAALVWSRYPALTVQQVRARILYQAEPLPSLHGLVRFGRLNAARALEDDAVPPSAPSSIGAVAAGASALLLEWTAPGDDGATGAASAYEIRYAPFALSEANVTSAPQAGFPPVPRPAGQRERWLLAGLAPDTAYFVAVRARDNVGNPSAWSFAGPFFTGGSTCLFYDDAEGTPQFQFGGSWAATSEARYSGSRSYTDSPGTSYSPNSDTTLTQIDPIALPAAPSTLVFWARLALEPGYDTLSVEVTEDGFFWTTLQIYTGIDDWRLLHVPLDAYAGRTIRIRFRLRSDFVIETDGVWLDEIRICATPAESVCVLDDGAEGTPAFAGAAPWGVSSEMRFSGDFAYSDSPGTLYQPGLDLALTQVRPAPLFGFVPRLLFRGRAALAFPGDYLRVDVSPDDGTTWHVQPFTLMGRDRLQPPAWLLCSVPLARYYEQSVRVRFRLVTDEDGEDEGVWLDEIRICGEPLTGETMKPGGQLLVARARSFPRVGVGRSASRTLVVRNLSRTEALSIDVRPPSVPDFEVTEGGGASVIPPRGRRRIGLRFTPQGTGARRGLLQIRSGDPAQPVAIVVLTGQGR